MTQDLKAQIVEALELARLRVRVLSCRYSDEVRDHDRNHILPVFEQALALLTDPNVFIGRWEKMEDVPKSAQKFLIFCKRGPVERIECAKYLTNYDADLSGWYTHNVSYYGTDVVTAWAHLPEPPKGEK